MRIVFCLPGDSYSGTFLKCFTNVWTWCLQNGIQPVLSQSYSSMVNFARCKVAGADVTNGTNQKPFDGVPYDYMMWIDSDQTFTIGDFSKLLSMQCDVASGWYNQPHGYTPVVEKLDDESRGIIYQRFFESKTAKEIGQENGYGRETARRRIISALEKLKQCLHN